MSLVPTIAIHHPQALSSAIKVLHQGGLVICPTETVYGALVDATNPQAVGKLLSYKRRPAGKAISIACASEKQAQIYVKLNRQAKQIYRTMLPGPVTIISVSQKKVVSSLESERGTLGVRLSSHPFLQQLLKKFPHPVTATSANSSGKKTPYCFNDLVTHLSGKQQQLIDLFIDAGRLPPNQPSLVIDTTTPTPTLLRQRPDLQEKIASLLQQYHSHNEKQTQQLAAQLLHEQWPVIQKSGLIMALDGDLGAGKTTFTKGLAKALGISSTVTSPSYTYLKEYPFNYQKVTGELIHVDAWAIDRPQTLTALNLNTYQQPGKLLVIEWFAQIKAWLKPKVPLLQVTISGENPREFTLYQS